MQSISRIEWSYSCYTTVQSCTQAGVQCAGLLRVGGHTRIADSNIVLKVDPLWSDMVKIPSSEYTFNRFCAITRSYKTIFNITHIYQCNHIQAPHADVNNKG